MWSFIQGSNIITKEGAFRGKDIISILPDFKRIMGWNTGYQLGAEDFQKINSDDLCFAAKKYQSDIKEVAYLATSQQNFLTLVDRLETKLLV